MFKIDFEKAYDNVNWDFLVLFYGRKILGGDGVIGSRGVCLQSLILS